MATITNRVVFETDVDKLKAKILSGTDAIVAMKSQVDRTAQALGGSGLLMSANKVTAAVDQLGGVTKLTAAEQAKINTLMGKAIEKYEALGKEAPSAMRELYDATKQAEDVTEGLGARVTGIVEASRAASGAMSEVVGIAKEWTDAYSGAETAAVRLDSALRAQGTYTPQLSAQYSALATQFERTTAFADDLVQESEAMLVTIGNVMPEDMERALKASTDLAAGMRIDLGSATQLVAKALEGNVGALKKHGIALDEAQIKAQGATVVFDALEQKFGGQAQAQAQTFAGEMSKLSNVIDNVQETLGGFIAGALSPLIDGFVSLPEPVRTGAVALGLVTSAAAAGAVAVAGLGAAAALAAPVFGFEAAGAGAAALTSLGTAASGAAIAFWPVAAAIAAVWAAWKIGNTETVKNSVAEWALSADNLTAKLYRWSLGLEKLSPAEAKAAVEATAAAEAASRSAAATNGAADSTNTLTARLLGFVGPQMDASTESRIYEDRLKKQDEATRKTAEATKKHAEELERYNNTVADVLITSEGYRAVLDTIDGTVLESVKYYRDAGVSLERLGQMYELSHVQLEALTQSEQAETESLKSQAAAMNAVATQMERRLKLIPRGAGEVLDEPRQLQRFDPDALKALNKAVPKSIWTRFGDQAADYFGGGEFGKTITGALMGGGGLKGGLEASASTLGGMFSQNLGASAAKAIGGTVGNIVGSFIGPLGSLLGPAVDKVISFIKNIGGPSKQEVAGRGIERQFEQSFGGFEAMMAAVGTAYDKAGMSAQEAQQDVAALLAAEKQGPAASQAWVDKIKSVMDQVAAKNAAIQTGVAGVVSAFKNAGSQIPDALKQSINDLAHMKGLTDDQRESLLNLTKDARPNFEQLQGTADKYGISLSQLGSKFDQGLIEDKSKSIFDDFTALTKAGGDAGGILAGMSDEVSHLVQESQQFGTKIPDNMKPLIENLISTGQLVDANGKKITDVGAISFEDTPISESMHTLIDSIKTLVDTLTNKLPSAIKNLPDKTIDITAKVHTSGDTGIALPGADVVDIGAATGGLVTRMGIQRFADGGKVLSFKPMGTDTVPAMLTPGEIVLNVAQQRRVATAIGSGSGGSMVDFESLRREQEETRREIRNLNGYMQTQFSRELSRAVRDEVQKVSWRRSRA